MTDLGQKDIWVQYATKDDVEMIAHSVKELAEAVSVIAQTCWSNLGTDNVGTLVVLCGKVNEDMDDVLGKDDIDTERNLT